MVWIEVSNEDVEVGQEVLVRWEDGPAIKQVQGYLAYVNDEFREILHFESGHPPRMMCVLHEREVYWYSVDAFAKIWVKSDDDVEVEDSKVSDAKKYVRDILSRPENSEGVKHKALWKAAWGLSDRRASQRKIKAAISEMVAPGEVRAEEAPRTPEGRAGGTLHWLAK